MNLLNLTILAMLVLSNNYGSEARAIDDVDNSIEAGGGGSDSGVSSDEPSQRNVLSNGSLRTHFGQDWIKFTQIPPAKILQTFGSSVEISCEVIGSQIPSIQWVVGPVSLPEIETIESNAITESSPTAIAKVHSVHIVDHMLSEARTYTCIGRTGSKTVYVSTTVYPQTDFKELVPVHSKPYTGHVKPRIVYSERLHLELVGSNVLLPCKVHARPKAEVFWMNGDGNIIEQNQHYKLLPSGHLLIADLKWEDMGAYKCIARNAMGKDTSDAFIYPVKREDK